MRKRLALILVVLIQLPGCSQDKPAPAAKSGGQFTASYSTPQKKQHRLGHQSLKDERVLEEFAAGLNDMLVLPKNVSLTTAECGTADAFYSPEQRAITLCYELVSGLVKQAEDLELDEEETENFIAGTLIFVLLHEVGHALVHVLDLPVTGKEEDAVDQLAAVLFMGGAEDAEEFEENAYLMSSAALWFAGEDEPELDGDDFADEHSLDQQRYYNLMCWIYGADPKAGADIIEDELLPRTRAERCEEEYALISKSWQRLLAAHMKK